MLNIYCGSQILVTKGEFELWTSYIAHQAIMAK